MTAKYALTGKYFGRRMWLVTHRRLSDTLRFECAIERLISSNCEVGEISAELSFDAQSHFYRILKQKLGFSPTQCRRVAHSG